MLKYLNFLVIGNNANNMTDRNANNENGHPISNTDIKNVGILIPRDVAALATITPANPVTILIHTVNSIQKSLLLSSNSNRAHSKTYHLPING